MSIQQYEQRAEMALSTPQDVAVHRLGEWAQSAQAAHSIAQTLVQTSFCPDSFRNKPGEATAAILAGMEVGLQPMAALRSFDIIQGQAAPRAITLRAIVQAAGHEIQLVESTATRCKMKGRRRGSTEWQSVTWTVERARDLGVTNKSNWRSQPQAMLVARATSELARLIASDAILGIGYSAEEIADGGVTEQQVADDTTPEQAPPARRVMRRTDPSPAPDVSASEPPEVAAEVEASAGEDKPDVITSGQLKKIGAAMRERGITERADALDFVNAVIGREVTSRNELSKAEAGAVIDALEDWGSDAVDAEVVEQPAEEGLA